MSDSRTYPLSTGQFAYLQANLVQMLQESGCDNIHFKEGPSGSISFHHAVPLSDGNFTVNYSYDVQAEQMNVEIASSPWVVNNGLLLAGIGDRLGSLPSAAPALVVA